MRRGSRKNGALSEARAADLHREDRQVRREERGMAGRNGGRIQAQAA